MSEELKTKEISSIHTSCKICCFAEYKEATQTGCAIGMLNKYKDKNTEIIEAYDDEKEFYIINNRRCVGFRKPSSFSSTDLSIEEKIESVKKSFVITYILFIDLKNLNLDDLNKIISDAKNFDIKPSKIIIMRYNYIEEKIIFDDIKTILQNSNLGCEWRVQTVVDSELETRSAISTAIDNNPKYKFILYLDNYSAECNAIINKANSLVFDDLESFGGLMNSKESCKMFLGLLYRYVWHTSRVDLLKDNTNFIVVQ